MLCKMTGALGCVVIGLHWLFAGHRKPLRFLLSIYMVPIVFFAGLFVCDSIVYMKWINPFKDFMDMMGSAGNLTFEDYGGGWEAYPWLWIFVPQNPTFYGTDVIRWQGLINPTLMFTIIPVYGYLVYRFIKGERQSFFSMLWFCGMYLSWIPVVLITDRLTYYFYFYPAIGAVAIAMAMVMEKLNKGRLGKTILLLWLSGHVASFLVLSPMQLWLSIPLCLILLAYIIWNMGIFKKPSPVNFDAPDAAQELSPSSGGDILPEETADSAAVQVDKQSEQ